MTLFEQIINALSSVSIDDLWNGVLEPRARLSGRGFDPRGAQLDKNVHTIRKFVPCMGDVVAL